MANEVDGPLTTTDIAKRAGLTVPGTQKALERLLKSGFISRMGGGRKHQYEIQRSDRLMQITLELFQAEKNRYERLLAAIKNGTKNLTPPPHAAWIKAVPREMDEPLILGLLHDSFNLTKCIRHLRAALNQIEKDFNLTIELEGYTRADIQDLDFDDVTILYGVFPTTSNGPAHQRGEKSLSHGERDHQQKLISQRLSVILKQDASLVRRAKDHIDRLLKEDQGMAARDLMELAQYF